MRFLVLTLLLLTVWVPRLQSQPTERDAPRGKGFALPLHRKTHLPARGRVLLRNSSYPLHGTVKDLGYFYATIYIGTPPRKFAVIVDTGSTITYVPCSSCGSNCGKHKDEAFDPATSSSFRSVSCNDPTCLCGNPTCQCHQDKCFYARHYAEQSSSEGFLIEDVLHLHDGSEAVPFRFGCETRETGEIFRQEADGIMGLGNSDASIINQGLYDIGYGVVLDSGTTFSYLPTEAYQGFLQLLEAHVKAKGLQRVAGPDPRFANTDICWGGAPTIEQAHRLGDHFPSLQLNFGGGVELHLHPLNYLFMHTRETGAYCLGVFDNGHQGTLLGGITFRNVLIKYDRHNQRVGFGYAACQRLGMDLAPPCDVMGVLQGDMADVTECREVSPHRAQSSGAAQAAPPPPQAPWTPSGGPGVAWRPGGEDGALRSEEGDMEGTSMVEVWQLLLASAGAVLALGGLLLGVAHAVMLLRARRRAVRQARYAELQDLSPPHSDSEAEPSGGGRRGPPLTLETRPASRTSSSGGSADALL